MFELFYALCGIFVYIAAGRLWFRFIIKPQVDAMFNKMVATIPTDVMEFSEQEEQTLIPINITLENGIDDGPPIYYAWFAKTGKFICQANTAIECKERIYQDMLRVAGMKVTFTNS